MNPPGPAQLFLPPLFIACQSASKSRSGSGSCFTHRYIITFFRRHLALRFSEPHDQNPAQLNQADDSGSTGDGVSSPAAEQAPGGFGPTEAHSGTCLRWGPGNKESKPKPKSQLEDLEKHFGTGQNPQIFGISISHLKSRNASLEQRAQDAVRSPKTAPANPKP